MTARAGVQKGALAQQGLLRDVDAAVALLDQVAGSDLETIRVVFADTHGVLRGKTIVASALPSVFDKGLNVPSTLLLKDTAHKTAYSVWQAGTNAPMQGAGDILLVPDPATFRPLPWAPHSAWLMCDAVALLEVEFHVFALDGPNDAHTDATMPPRAPRTRNLTQGWQFLTDAHYAQLEPVMDDLRRMAAGLGMSVRSTEVEMGPSQFEFTFDPSDPMTHADNMMMFRAGVKQVCAAQGLHATFMCRPVVPNAAASGWHLHQSLRRLSDGEAVFATPDGALTPECSAWIAGLLAHARESCLLSTPTVNGYKRYQPHQLAPDAVVWGRDNRGAMVRAILPAGDRAARVENRVAEPTANPYLFFASQIECGLSGLRNGWEAPAATEDPYGAGFQKLPRSLGEAISAFDGGALYRGAWGDQVVDHLVTLKRAEWDRYLAALSQWEQDEYFSLF